MTIIDVHTHAYTRRWLEILREQRGEYGMKLRPDGHEEIYRGETPVAFPQPGHFDYDLRIKQMDTTGLDSFAHLPECLLRWRRSQLHGGAGIQ